MNIPTPSSSHLAAVLDRVGLADLVGKREIRMIMRLRTERLLVGSETWDIFVDVGSGTSLRATVEYMRTPTSDASWWGESTVTDAVPTVVADIMHRIIGRVADFATTLTVEVADAVA
jgi:DNA helicase TIP49 (TBP-interacting protein)